MKEPENASFSGCIRIAVIGPGAMGRLIASCLHDIGIETWLVDHRPDRADELNRTGVRVIRDEEKTPCLFHIPVTALPEQAGVMDWIIIMVKSYQTPSVLSAVRAMSDSSTMVLSLQNGMGQEEIITKAIDKSRIVLGITAHGAAMYHDTVRHAGKGQTVIGTCLPDSSNGMARCKGLASMLNRAGWETSVEKDIAPFRWKKLIANCAINALTAISGVKNGALVKEKLLEQVMFMAAEEAWETACAHGVNLHDSKEEILDFVREICVRTAENRSSMLQDVTHSRQTEIDFINGIIIKKAGQAGIIVPVNTTLTALIKHQTG